MGDDHLDDLLGRLVAVDQRAVGVPREVRVEISCPILARLRFSSTAAEENGNQRIAHQAVNGRRA